MSKFDELKKLAKKATQGIWEIEAIQNTDASYGSGPDCGTGFTAYEIIADRNSLLDTLGSNASIIEVADEGDDSQYAWDSVAKANLEFIAAANPAAILELLAIQAQLVEALTAICDMQQRNFGDGIATHIALIGLSDDGRVALAVAGAQP